MRQRHQCPISPVHAGKWKKPQYEQYIHRTYNETHPSPHQCPSSTQGSMGTIHITEPRAHRRPAMCTCRKLLSPTVYRYSSTNEGVYTT
ncbi:hypothetical protein GDO81_012198 [Engystomops pustulosus]|uniref:Uncharacterized protein n=1 Tax=Engystomops pustulosus TaxID=76066 RepID=A0AAV7BKD2_ENGPU|nr:hypothetical protein GDO81_012198 [Engystomops pustulosus]